MKMINAFLFLALAGFSGCAFQVPLSNNLLAAPQPVTSNKLPLNVGLVIDAQTKNFQQKVRPSGGAQVHTFGFSVGQGVSEIISNTSKTSFEKVAVLDNLPLSPSKDFDAFLIVKDLTADIQIGYTNTGTQAAMAGLMGPLGTLTVTLYKKTNASLSISARMVDSNLNDIFSSTVFGKGNSLVPSTFSGMHPEEFSGGVNEAMQDLARNLMTEILTSQKIKDYAASIKTT